MRIKQMATDNVDNFIPLSSDTVTVLSVEVEKARETSQNKSNPNKLMKEVSLENQSNQKR
jgi:hypothetical protein